MYITPNPFDVISAGYFEKNQENISCYTGSFSLDIDPRPKEDAKLLAEYFDKFETNIVETIGKEMIIRSA